MATNPRHCSQCVHWSSNVCVDRNGNPIERKEKLAPEPFWTYEECKKNWGLPKSAFISAVNCNFYKAK